VAKRRMQLLTKLIVAEIRAWKRNEVVPSDNHLAWSLASNETGRNKIQSFKTPIRWAGRLAEVIQKLEFDERCSRQD
jgi:hypothetical protein